MPIRSHILYKMRINETSIAWVSIVNSWMVFALLIVVQFGGLHLEENISLFVEYYTLIILIMLIFPAIIFSAKWCLTNKWKKNRYAIVCTLIFLGTLLFYYIK